MGLRCRSQTDLVRHAAGRLCGCFRSCEALSGHRGVSVWIGPHLPRGFNPKIPDVRAELDPMPPCLRQCCCSLHRSGDGRGSRRRFSFLEGVYIIHMLKGHKIAASIGRLLGRLNGIKMTSYYVCTFITAANALTSLGFSMAALLAAEAASLSCVVRERVAGRSLRTPPRPSTSQQVLPLPAPEARLPRPTATTPSPCAAPWRIRDG